MARFLIPLVIFIMMAVLFLVGLGKDPRDIPSALKDKPMPAFDLPRVKQPNLRLSDSDLSKKVSLVNFWASWCPACKQEHHFLVELSNKKVPIFSINYKDKQVDAVNWLNRLGDPYIASGFDEKGDVGIDWGIIAVPETFIVDSKGTIRYKHTGAVTPEVWKEILQPLMLQLEKES